MKKYWHLLKKEMPIWVPWDSPIIRRRIRDRVQIVSAIGLHDESTGGATDPISAALIIADKTDVRRSRVGRRIRQPSINTTASIMRLRIRSLRSMWRREWFHWICRLIRRSAACMSILRYSLDVWWCVSAQRKCWRHPLSWPWTDLRCCKLRVSEENCI